MPRKIKIDSIGKTFEFPDGTPDDVIDKAVREEILPHYAQQQSAPTLTNQAPQQPGFGTMFGRTMGAPTSPEEAGGMLMGKSGSIEGAPDSAYNPQGGVNLPGGFNPGNAARNVFTNVGQSIADRIKSGSQQFGEAAQNIRQGGPILSNIGKGLSGYTDIISATNPVVNAGGESGKQFAEGNIPGGLGAFTAGMMQGGAMGRGMGVAEPPNLQSVSPRGALANRMAEVPAGSKFTRGQVLQAAKDAGINLDLAQATDHPVAKVVKKFNENSLTGNSTYEANRAANQGALENLADTQKGKFSPVTADREVVGGQIQDALRKDLVERKAAATEAFQDLDKRVGSNTIDATNTVEEQARKIIAENKGYYAKHPELIPKQAWAIVEDLAKRPQVVQKNPAATAPGLMDAAGAPVNATGTFSQAPAKAKFMTWSELHQLRSDLMDIYRNNPDIVKGQSERWLQTMVGTIDNAMTNSAGGLRGADLAQFRAANANWESIKGTYDNPQSPLYQAIRTPYQSQVANMLSRSTPELARQVRATLGSVEGPFQRQFVEQLINSKDGVTPDFKNLGTRLRRIPNDHLEAMIGKEGAKNLRMLGELAQKVTADSNPSGTAKVGQPAAEAAAAIFHPATGVPELVAQYGTAKAMNSARLTDYLTRKKMVPKR